MCPWELGALFLSEESAESSPKLHAVQPASDPDSGAPPSPAVSPLGVRKPRHVGFPVWGPSRCKNFLGRGVDRDYDYY